MRRILPVVAFLLLFLKIVSCTSERYHYKLSQSTSTLQLWTATPSKKVFRDDPVPTLVEDTVKMYSAKNEHEPFIVVLRPTSSMQVTVNLPDFGNPLFKTKLFIVDYVDVQLTSDKYARMGMNPDPLLPEEDGYQFSLLPNVNNVIWVDVFVPIDGVDGAEDYTGNLKLSGGVNIEIPVNLHVFNFEIPRMPHINIHMSGYTPTVFEKYSLGVWNFDNTTRYFKYLDLYMDFLLSHRLQLIKGTTPCQLRGIHGGDTRYNCETKEFDVKEPPFNPGYDCESRIPTFMHEGRPIDGTQVILPYMMPVGSICKSNDDRAEEMCGVTRQPSDFLSKDMKTPFNKVYGEYLAALQRYLEKFGVVDRFSFYITDEPGNQLHYDCVAWGTQLIKHYAPKLRTFVTEPPEKEIYDNKNYTKSKIDIWCPVLYQFQEEECFERKHHCHEEIWTYFLWDYTPSISSIKLDDQGIAHILMGWFLWRFRITGLLYYGFIRWHEFNPWVDTNPPEYDGRLAGEQGMLYPPSRDNSKIPYGSNGHKLIPSIRVELFRDSLEMYEYLYVLNGNKHPTTDEQFSFVDQLAKVMVPSKYGMVRNDEIAYNLRRAIGLYIGKEISKIDLDLELSSPHPRTDEDPGNYYINFQNRTHPPGPLVVDGKTYFQCSRERYNEENGFGFYFGYDWFREMYFPEEDFPELNELKRSTVRVRKHTFVFALPNGGYDVTLTIGWAYWSAGDGSNYVKINGVQFFENRTLEIGEFASVTKTIFVTGKFLIMQTNEVRYAYLTHMEIESNGKKSGRNDDAVSVGTGTSKCRRGGSVDDFLRYGLFPILLIACCVPFAIFIAVLGAFLPKIIARLKGGSDQNNDKESL